MGDKGAREIYKHIQDKYPLAIEKVNIPEEMAFYDFDTEDDFKKFLSN